MVFTRAHCTGVLNGRSHGSTGQLLLALRICPPTPHLSYGNMSHSAGFMSFPHTHTPTLISTPILTFLLPIRKSIGLQDGIKSGPKHFDDKIFGAPTDMSLPLNLTGAEQGSNRFTWPIIHKWASYQVRKSKRIFRIFFNSYYAVTLLLVCTISTL